MSRWLSFGEGLCLRKNTTSVFSPILQLYRLTCLQLPCHCTEHCMSNHHDLRDKFTNIISCVSCVLLPHRCRWAKSSAAPPKVVVVHDLQCHHASVRLQCNDPAVHEGSVGLRSTSSPTHISWPNHQNWKRDVLSIIKSRLLLPYSMHDIPRNKPWTFAK